jgi:putative DNA primase/helicase
MSNPIEQFKLAIEAAGLTPPNDVIADGKLHRFSSNGKQGETAGWYVLHLDGLAAGAFGCWRAGFTQNWCIGTENVMTQAERCAYHERKLGFQLKKDEDLALRQLQGRETAAYILANASPAESHEYLTAKGIHPHGVKYDGLNLIIPMRDSSGILHSLQTISPEGKKLFHRDGKVSGCYYSIGQPNGVVIVCEGFATGASLHECTGNAVAVAFSAGNLLPVVVDLHAKYPSLKIIVAADDDHLTPGNPGLTKARAAAKAVNGMVAVPEFGVSRPAEATDFNDLHQIVGVDAVKLCLEGAVISEAPAIFDWPEPISLPNALPPVDAFDADLLPMALRPWVMDISHRMQCPADFPAVAAMVALSSLIGARAVIQPKTRDDWQVVPNLWGAAIGRTGVKKSPALNEALKPLHHLEAAELQLSKAAHDSWKIDCKLAEMQSESNEKKAKALAIKDPAAARALLAQVELDVEPKKRSYVENDASVEGLGVVLSESPWGLLAYRDELYGLLTSLDKPGQEGSRAFYLQGYDGNQGYKFTRISRGTTYIPRVCLAMIGGIQPGKMQEYVRGAVAGGSADDGLLQRFGLAVWPDITSKFIHVDEWPDTPARQTAWAVFERLAQLEPANDTDPVIWRFSPAAQEIFVEWLVPFETEIRGDSLHPAMASHLAKYRKLIPALALVFALIDTPDSGGLVHEAEILRALAWGDYLRSHAVRLYAAAVTPETTGAEMLLAKIKLGKLTGAGGALLESFSAREVVSKGWTGLGESEVVRKAADLLTEFDWLRRDLKSSGGAGGRPSERYSINPAAFKGGSL